MRPMDECLPQLQVIWDSEEAQSLRAKLPRIPSLFKDIVKPDDILQDVHGAYHIIGGHARLADVANKDPKWFYKHFKSYLLPAQKQEVDVNHRIFPPLPPSPLDGDFTDAEEVANVQLDKGSDQAPRSITQGAQRTSGRENSPVENGEGGALVIPKDSTAGGPSSHTPQFSSVGRRAVPKRK